VNRDTQNGKIVEIRARSYGDSIDDCRSFAGTAN